MIINIEYISKKTKREIHVGRYYFIHDGSKTGHPGLLVWSDESANLYLFTKFGTSSNKDNLPLSNSLSENVKTQFFYKRPLLVKRKDIGKEWFFDCQLSDTDKNTLNATILNNPIFTKNINRRDKRYYLLAMKIGKIKTVI